MVFLLLLTPIQSILIRLYNCVGALSQRDSENLSGAPSVSDISNLDIDVEDTQNKITFQVLWTIHDMQAT